MLQVKAMTEDASSEYTLDNEVVYTPVNLMHIMADGQELAWIKTKFSTTFRELTGTDVTVYSIPMIHTADRMYWKGDIAKTILINLW